MISRVAVVRHDGKFYTDPLWALDVNANSQELGGLRLICPVHVADGVDAIRSGKLDPLDPLIEITGDDELSDDRLEALIEKVEVVELPGNFDWSRAALARRVLRIARRHGRLTILGISSNRVKTTLMNAQGKGFAGRLRARLRAENIRRTQRYLARRVDAVRVVGQGVARLVEDRAKTVNVEVASWIRSADIEDPKPELHDPATVMIASRLEPMKGIRVGIDAAAEAIAGGTDIRLSIVGVGAEEARLRERVSDRGIDAQTEFTGQLAYPGPFFGAVHESDFVLLTNLNDEQPRLIFDAISRGAIPICPRNTAYNDLGLDSRIFYEQGNARSLADTLVNLINAPIAVRMDIQLQLKQLARTRTIESMHAQRARWIRGLLGREMIEEPKATAA
ncbi:glycosyltransferase [Profundibacterium mesophilum]|uniref:LPS biosynthesis RfbU related protein n=1 Tax=Profundibacterium mesophilum KAUST100406-0324 TaxID=1037889 RepID=A0A921TB30_9RHOB|nr:glycosyltransferase [Profundibacterium mesophilum]KAF0674760.1 LPS biosynthesis RfbU related protein [Profundibacterium mesophilum KAUST100406-0324]